MIRLRNFRLSLRHNFENKNLFFVHHNWLVWFDYLSMYQIYVMTLFPFIDNVRKLWCTIMTYLKCDFIVILHMWCHVYITNNTSCITKVMSCVLLDDALYHECDVMCLARWHLVSQVWCHVSCKMMPFAKSFSADFAPQFVLTSLLVNVEVAFVVRSPRKIRNKTSVVLKLTQDVEQTE